MNPDVTGTSFPNQIVKRSVCILVLAAIVSLTAQAAFAASASKINKSASEALHKLYAKNEAARMLSKEAKAILIFPAILKAGFIVGGQGGDGVLLKGGRPLAYYRSVAASYGLQAGVQEFGFALFFMSNDALTYLDKSGGWEVGVGPSIVVVDEGVGKTLTTTTGRSDVYAFIFNQKGLMAGLGIQGSKITKITPDK